MKEKNKRDMQCKVFITDEGFGPIVRQNAIVEELRILDKNIGFTIQTQEHLSEARRIFRDVKFKKKYNLITWHKSSDGSPDTDAIRKYFKDYKKYSDKFIADEMNDEPDFIISDFVYEAFEIARRKKIPSFGVAHFTWDWFFSKLFPPPIETNVLQRFLNFAILSDVLYFPPFTPGEILRHFHKKVVRVPLILRKNIKHKKISSGKKFNVLIIDSGSRVMTKHIQKAVDNLGKLNDFHFFISSAFKSNAGNISFIGKNEFFIDYISQMDLVIARAGFNTISECIGLRTPMLLLSESRNPEMNENIVNIKKAGLGSFISEEDFSGNLQNFLPRFVNREYKTIKEKMKNHNYETDGARVIAEDILNRIKK